MKNKIYTLIALITITLSSYSQGNYTDHIEKAKSLIENNNETRVITQLKKYKKIFGDYEPRVLITKDSKDIIRLSDFDSQEAFDQKQSEYTISGRWFNFSSLNFNVLVSLPIAKVCQAANISTDNAHAVRCRLAIHDQDIILSQNLLSSYTLESDLAINFTLSTYPSSNNSTIQRRIRSELLAIMEPHFNTASKGELVNVKVIFEVFNTENNSVLLTIAEDQFRLMTPENPYYIKKNYLYVPEFVVENFRRKISYHNELETQLNKQLEDANWVKNNIPDYQKKEYTFSYVTERYNCSFNTFNGLKTIALAYTTTDNKCKIIELSPCTVIDESLEYIDDLKENTSFTLANGFYFECDHLNSSGERTSKRWNNDVFELTVPVKTFVEPESRSRRTRGVEQTKRRYYEQNKDN